MRIFNFDGFNTYYGVKIVGANSGFAYIFGDSDIELAIDRDVTFAIGVVEYKGKNKSDILFGITWDNVKKWLKQSAPDLSNEEILLNNEFQSLQNAFMYNILSQIMSNERK